MWSWGMSFPISAAVARNAAPGSIWPAKAREIASNRSTNAEELIAIVSLAQDSLRHELTAVDMNILAGDVTAERRRSEEKEGARAFLRRADATEIDRLPHRLHAFGGRLGMKRRRDDPRRNRVYADAASAEIAGEMACQIMNEGFRRSIHRRSRAAPVITGDRAYVDDRAARALLEVGDRRLARRNNRAHIEVEDLVDQFVVNIGERGATNKRARVVDEYVKAAEFFDRIGHDTFGFAPLG